MDVIDAIRDRRAIRDYKPDEVPEGFVRRLIAAASWAPSAMNEQPWHFTVVTDRALMNDMSASAKAWMLESVDGMSRSTHFAHVLSDPQFNIFYNAPLLLAISGPAQNQWCVEDCALAAENGMLAAVEMGLGSCWIGFAQGWLNSEAGLAALGMPERSRVVAPVIFGFPKAKLPPVARKSPSVKWIDGRVRPKQASLLPQHQVPMALMRTPEAKR